MTAPPERVVFEDGSGEVWVLPNDDHFYGTCSLFSDLALLGMGEKCENADAFLIPERSTREFEWCVEVFREGTDALLLGDPLLVGEPVEMWRTEPFRCADAEHFDASSALQREASAPPEEGGALRIRYPHLIL